MLVRGGHRLSSNETVRAGDLEVCGHPSCRTVLAGLVPHPSERGSLLMEPTGRAGADRLYRARCVAQAEPHPGQPGVGPEQLVLL